MKSENINGVFNFFYLPFEYRLKLGKILHNILWRVRCKKYTPSFFFYIYFMWRVVMISVHVNYNIIYVII